VPFRLPFSWPTDRSLAARKERQEQLERRLTDAFRQLSQVFGQAAELIERRRLERQGIEQPERTLERVTKPRP
jgi:outer membrane protein TolC